MSYDKYFIFFLGPIILMGSHSHAQFIDRAQEYGIVHNFGELGFGSGISLVDINGDGRDDLTLGTGLGVPLAVYFQTDSGFVPADEPSLLDITQAVRGLNWVDYDNDGDKDLFITYFTYTSGGGMSLYNQDSGQYTEVTFSAGLDTDAAPLYGSTWADYDSDGFLDLYVCKYYTGDLGQNYLYHNNGDGTFNEVTSSLGVSDSEGFSFNSVFFDMDMDGDMDLFTSNDRSSENRIYENNETQTFQDVSAIMDMNVAMNSMGAELGDFDNDHDLDLYVTNTIGNFQGHVGNALFRNDSADFEWLPGSLAGDDVGTFWGCNFVDYDFDRDLDLFTVNSVRDTGGSSIYFYINDGSGTFSEYLGTEFDMGTGHHFASAQGDLNSDGYLDLVVADGYQGTSQIWIGPTTENHWIKVHLEGTLSNKDAIGTIIEAWSNGQKRIDQTTCTSSHLAQDSFNYPFGLGTSTQADSVIIKWPSGIINKVYTIPCEQTINIIENADEVILDCSPEIQFTPVLISGLNQSFELQTSGDVFQINWTIDGELVGTGNDYTHTFESLGEHLVCVELVTSCASISACETINLFCTAPTANFNYLQDNLLFTASCITVADSILWIMGDGTVLSGESIEHYYNEPGIYTLCVIISNECASDSICAEIEVICALPESGFEFTTELLSFQASHTGVNADSLSWIMGDGTILSGDEILYTYAESGSYELCLIAINSCGVDSLCATIDVECPFPVAGFELTSSSFVIEATSLSELADSLIWYLDGVLVSTETTWSELVSEFGVYEVCLEVFNTCGTDSVCQSILIGPNGLLNVHSESDLLIFPNPAADLISFRLSGLGSRILTYSLIDELGREIQELTILPSSTPQGLITLPISALDPGSYTLLILEKKRILHCGQFIKD